METNNPQPPVFNPGQGQQPLPSYPYQPQQPPVRELPQLGFGEAVKTCFAKYADFNGRARRSEFWWWILFMSICSTALSFLLMFLGAKVVMVGSLLLSLALLCPLLAVQTRRLHDTGHGGLIVGITAFFYLVLMALYVKVYWPIMDLASSDPFAAADALSDALGTLGIALGVCGVVYSVLMLVLFIFNLQDSHRDENKYGPSPKYQ